MNEAAKGGRRGLLALVALLALAGLLGAPPASAAGEHPYLPALHLEGLEAPCGATTDSYGNLYVAEAEGAIEIYDPAGELLTEFVPGEFSPAFTHCSIAVDRTGAVYVAGFGIPSDRLVAKYRPVGGAYPPSSSTEYELDEAAGDEGVLVDEDANAVAVDPDTGDVYVAEEGTNEVQNLLVPPVAQCPGPDEKVVFAWTPSGEVGATEVACGASEGAVEAALEDLLGPGTVDVLSPERVPNDYRVRFTGELGNTGFPAGVLEVREVGSGTVLSTSVANPNVNGAPSRISIYESDGTPVSGPIGTEVGGAAYYGVDVDAASGRVFAVDVQNVLVDVFDPAVSRGSPSATIDGSDNPNFPAGFGDLYQGFLAVDQTTGNFFVDDVGYSYFGHANEGNGVIAQFTPVGEFVSQVGPAFGEVELEFESEIYWPIGIAVDDGLCSPSRGNVYVAANWESVYAFAPTSPFAPAAPTVTAVDPSRGPTAGGNTVTVTGADLGCADLPGGEVEFGGAPATDVEVNARGSELTATVPAHTAGTVDVTVTTPNGSSAPTVAGEYAYLAPRTLTVSEVGTGSGSVTCDDSPCEASYPYGSSITLEAAPAAGSTFGGWSGACAGTGDCVVTVDADTAVTASFDAVQEGGDEAGKRGREGAVQTPPPPAGAGRAKVARRARVRAGKAPLRISCPGPGACRGTVKLTARVKAGRRTKTIAVGFASYDIPAGGTAVVEVTLTRRARKLVERGGLRVRARGPGIHGTLRLKRSARPSGKRRSR